jgi:hypothetical protein
MKFRVILKDPDGFSEGVMDAVDDELKRLNLNKDDQETLREPKELKLFEFLEKWVEYSEYVTLEFDTEEKTAIVVDRK